MKQLPDVARPALAWLVLSVAACGTRTPPEDASAAEETGPILPAPEADLYITGGGQPRDLIVAGVVGDRPWDEALSGAAGAVALAGEDDPTLAEARWAAFRAGYPYPVQKVVVGAVAADAEPRGLDDALDGLLGPGVDLGVARARVGEEDRWVALAAQRAGTLPGFAREFALGEAFALELADAHTWALVSPDGAMFDGAGAIDHRLNAEGEWWLQVESGQQVVTSVPLYVGMSIPPAPPFPEDAEGDGPTTPTRAAELAVEHLQALRDDFGLAIPQVDATLRTLAAAPLADLRDGSFQPGAATERLRGAGFVGGPADALGCVASTVAGCLNQLAFDADDRAALLDPGHRVVGVAADLRTSDVALVVHLASE